MRATCKTGLWWDFTWPTSLRCELQVLGDGDLSFALTVKAEAISESAKAKIEAAGGAFEEVPQKPKWTRKLHKERLAAAETKAGKSQTTK